MKLIIDTRKGIAGDIVSSGLIGLGADENKIIKNMELTGNFLGKTEILKIDDDESIKLNIMLEPDNKHLLESKGREILDKMFNNINLEKLYQEIGLNVYKTLCEAENFIHSSEKFHFLKSVTNEQSKSKEREAVLHEAKDILIDIIGFSTGLKELNINKISYLDYVNVGNGTIEFSHGKLNVPAPATEYILNNNKIVWKKSHIPNEMATPTGVSILAGSKAKRIKNLTNMKIIKRAFGKGTKNLSPIPFYLIKE